jgi:hypothetical protein
MGNGEWRNGEYRGISRKSITSQLLHVLQDIHKALESRNQVDAVYLDLGPLLFLVFVNDLPHSISGELTVAMFADDTKCYRPVKDLTDWEGLQNDLNDLVNWCTYKCV